MVRSVFGIFIWLVFLTGSTVLAGSIFLCFQWVSSIRSVISESERLNIEKYYISRLFDLRANNAVWAWQVDVPSEAALHSAFSHRLVTLLQTQLVSHIGCSVIAS